MAKYVELPDGSLFPVKEGEDYSSAMRAAFEKYPDAFGQAPTAKAEPEGGFIPALKSGISGVKTAGLAVAGRTGLMDMDRAKQAMAEEQAYREKTFKPSEKGWTEDPLTKTKELLGQSLPYTVAPLVAAAIAPEAAIPLGIAGLTTSGATLASIGAGALQYTGTGLSRQVDEGRKLEETNLGAAALASVPTAIFDRLSFGMIPGIRNIFGQAGKQMTTAEAKAFVEQGLKKTAADYALATGKAIGTESLTEAAQQFLERAQAGLSLTDAKARDEYWDSLVGGAVLGGVLSPVGRYMERGGEKAKAQALIAQEKQAQATAAQQQAEAQAAQTAAEEEKRKQQPEYALEKKAEYDAALQEFNKLKAAAKTPPKDAEPLVQQEAKTAKAELKKFVEGTMNPLSQEYARLKRTGIYDRIAEEQRVANLSPIETLIANKQPRVTAPRLGAEGPEATPFTELAASRSVATTPAMRYAEEQIALANERSLTSAKERGDQVSDYTQYLLQEPKMAAQLVMGNARLPGVNAKTNQAVLTNLRDTLKMQRAAGWLDSQFNRVDKRAPYNEIALPTRTAESEEEQALAEARRAEKLQALEAEREVRLAPETNALRRIAERPFQTAGLPGFGETKEGPTPSPAFGQMQQSLRGVPLGQEELFTAEEVQPAPERKVQKGPGGGFRLFNEQGERQLSDEQAYRNLSERLAIASTNPDLSDEAYDFLRRAETVLPRVNTRLEEARTENIKYGEGPLAKKASATDVASSESFYKLLDEQLARIERGEEGVFGAQRYVQREAERARGSAAGITPPTEAVPREFGKYRETEPTALRQELRRKQNLKYPTLTPQPTQEERAVANVPGAPRSKLERATTPRTLRGSATGLSLAAELEPLIRAQEEARGEGPIREKQKELFPSAGKELGIQRANYKALMNSKVVQRLREALSSNKKVADMAKNLPKMQEQVKKLQAEVERMQKINLEYSNAARTLQMEKDVGRVRRNMNDILAALTKNSVEGMQLDGRIEALQQMRGELINEGRALGETVELPLLAELNENEVQLERAKVDSMELRGAIETLKGQLRVQEAKNTLARLNPQTVSKETLAAAQEALRAAQTNAGVAEATIRKEELAQQTAAAKARREAEAVRLAEAEKSRIDLSKERQRRLEAAYGTSATGQEYEIINVAQRRAQEMQPVTFTVQEKKKIMSNPTAVLAGYRARITELERVMKTAYDRSYEIRDKQLLPLADKVTALNEQYKKAGAEARANLLPQIEAAEAAYDDAANLLRDEPLVWKGKEGQLKALADAYNRAETLEADINAGRIVQPEEFKRKSPTIKPSKGEKEGAAAAAKVVEVEEAKQRATAPSTTGEAGVTRSVAAKQRAPQPTVYSSKGLGQEGLSKEKAKALERIKDKQAAGIPLSAFDTELLAEAKRMSEVIKSANTPVEKPKLARGVETISPDLTKEQVAMLEKNDITGALDSFADDKNTSKLNKVIAQRLAAMLDDTNVVLQKNLKDDEGAPVLGMATSKKVTLDRDNGLSQEVLLHEGTHAATERVLVQYKEDPSKLTEIQRVAVRELTALHKAIQNDPRITSVSAKGSLSEFVAEVFSNRNLQEQLRGKKWKLSDAWKGFKSIIMRMLGVKDPETMFGAALQSIDALMIPSSQRMGGVETAVTRQLSQKDIAALHTGSNSMKQFAEQFGMEIKQKDRTAEDANRIGLEYLNTMESYPTDYVAEAQPNKLQYDLRMSDGEKYDPKNMAHYFEATPQTIMNYEASNNEELRDAEASDINTKRVDDLRLLIDNLKNNPEYTYVEQALVAKAASKYAVLADKFGKLKLSEIAADNRHNIAVVGTEDAARVIEELRAGKPLKQAFLDGLQKNANENAKKNARKNGWQKFEQSDDYQAGVELNAGAANTSWCTGANVNTALGQINKGDFYIYYADGKPEVAIRMDGSNQIGEIRGNTVNQSLTPQQQEIARAFLTTNNFDGADTYMSQMARKDALAKAFREGTPLPTDVLYGEQWGQTSAQANNGLYRVSIPMRSVYVFTNFTDIDGEIEEYRPEKPEGFEKKIIAKLTEALHVAMENNEFPGIDMFFYENDTAGVVFEGKSYKVSPQELRGVSTLTLAKGELTFPNLEKVDKVFMMEDVDASLPKIKNVREIDAESTQPTSTLTFAKDATVGSVRGSAQTGVSKTFLTINNATTVGNVLTDWGSVIDLKLPDTKYVKLPEFDFAASKRRASIAASNVFEDWVKENKYNAAFGRYRRNQPAAVGDETKMSKVGAKAYAMAVKLTNMDRADRLLVENTDTYLEGEPETIRWGVPARPAFRPPPAPRAIARTLAETLGREPTEAEVDERFNELVAERERERAAREEDIRATRTLKLTQKQKELIDGENEARDDRDEKLLETDEEKAAFLEDYYKRNPGKEVSKTDFLSVVMDAAIEYFEGVTTPEAAVKRAEKFNELLNVPVDVQLQTKLDTVDAPNRVGDRPTVKGVIEAPEQPVYARPQYNNENAATALADMVVAQPKSFKERLGNNLTLQAEMETVDMRAAVREFLKAGAKSMGNDKMFDQAMYAVLKADQYMPLVSASLNEGPLEIKTDEKGLHGIESSGKNSGKDVFDAVAKVPAKNSQGKFALASIYMIAQRAANKGLTKLDLGALGVTEEKLAAAMRDIDADPAMKAALENVRTKYNAYNAGMIKFLASTGYISKQTAADWLREGDYVPYYRVREDGTAELVFGGDRTLTIGDIRHQPYLQELKGGETKILPLNESIPRNTMLITKAAMYNLAAKNMAYAMQAVGKGRGEIDPKTGKPKDLMAIHSGRNPGGSNIIVFRQEPNAADPDDNGMRWVRVQTEGTVAEGIPSALLVKSMEGAHLTLPSFLKLGGMAGDLLRKGITRMPPYILRQLYRDPMAATFTGGLNYNPLTAVLKAGNQFLQMSRGSSKTEAELIKKGLIQSNIYTGDPDDISAFALQLASGKDQGAIDKLLAMADRASLRADAATRALVLENARANGLSEVEADMMVMESMNFYKRGLAPGVQYANRMIPFLNAQMQGLNVLAKAARGNMPFNERQQIQRKFYNNALLLFGTGFLYAMAMDDDKYFKNAKPKDKYSNFFLHLPGVKEPLKIAIPYEAGWFFSAAVAAVDATKESTDTAQQWRAIKDMFLNAVPGYSSNFVPQIVKPIAEVGFNKNFFSGLPIESPSMQTKRVEERYTNNTTETAKALSRMLPVLSPVQIEHLTRAYFGLGPMVALGAAGSLFEKPSATEKPEGRITDMPVIGSMFQKEYGGAESEAVYAIAKAALQTQASFNSLKKSGTAEDLREFAQENRAELAVAPVARAYETRMAHLKTQEDVITNRLKLSAAEKRARIDELDQVRQKTTEEFMKRIKAVEARYEKTIPQ